MYCDELLLLHEFSRKYYEGTVSQKLSEGCMLFGRDIEHTVLTIWYTVIIENKMTTFI